MTTYLHRQPDQWRRRVVLGHRAEFAAQVQDRIHVTLLRQWDDAPAVAGNVTHGAQDGQRPPSHSAGV